MNTLPHQKATELNIMGRDISEVYASLGIQQEAEVYIAPAKLEIKGINNMSQATDLVEIEVEDEIIEEVSTEFNADLNKLMKKYQKAKSSSTKASAILTDNTTIKDMDSINEMVAEAMLKIGEFASNGQQEGYFKSKMSSALAIVDPNQKWAAKWLDSSEEKAKVVEMNNKSITQVISDLVADIEGQRDAVVEYIINAAQVKASMESEASAYEKMLVKANHVFNNTDANTRENFDALQLVTALTSSIESIKTDIASHVNPLLAAANVSVKQITTILPTIESDLQSKMGFKAFQQKLTDLNQMTSQVASLSMKVGETINKEINDTVIESIAILGETGLDTDRMRKIAGDEAKHQARINTEMNKVQVKINKTFNEVKQLAHESQEARAKSTNQLLVDYSDTKTIIAG